MGQMLESSNRSMVISAAEDAEAALDSYQLLAGRMLQWYLERKGQNYLRKF